MGTFKEYAIRAYEEGIGKEPLFPPGLHKHHRRNAVMIVRSILPEWAAKIKKVRGGVMIDDVVVKVVYCEETGWPQALRVQGLCPFCGETAWSYECETLWGLGKQLAHFQPDPGSHFCVGLRKRYVEAFLKASQVIEEGVKGARLGEAWAKVIRALYEGRKKGEG
jgi:hypothetical protein